MGKSKSSKPSNNNNNKSSPNNSGDSSSQTKSKNKNNKNSSSSSSAKSSKIEINDNAEITDTSMTEILVKKVFPYLALPLIPLISSSNAVMTRAAYIYVPEGKEPLDPFVLGCLRMYQAFFCFLFARWWRNEIMLKKYSTETHHHHHHSHHDYEAETQRIKKSSNKKTGDGNDDDDDDDGNQNKSNNEKEKEELENLEDTVVVPISDFNGTPRISIKEFNEKHRSSSAAESKSSSTKNKQSSSVPTSSSSSITSPKIGPSSPSSSALMKMHTLNEAKPSNVIEALSVEDQRRHKEEILRNPERVSPALMDILQAWILGLLTCGNVFLFTKGIQYTDGTTTAAFLAMIPPSTFVIGFALGLEKYSHSRALATLLILVGNVIMNHLWRLVHGDFSDGKHTVMYYLGSLMLFVSCLCAGGYFVLQRPLSSRMSFLDFFVHMYGFGAAVAWIISLFPRENLVTRQLLSGLYPAAWGAIFVGGVLQCFVGFLLVAFVSNFTGSSVIVTLVRASAPVLIVAESIFLLGEELDQYQVYGGALILSGVLLALVPVFCADGGIMKNAESEAQKQKTSESKKNEIAGDERRAADQEYDDADEEFVYDSRVESIVIADPSTILPVSIPIEKV